VSPAKTAEPIEVSFGTGTRVGPGKHALDGVHTGATTEPSMCGGDAAFLSNYFDHLFLVLRGIFSASLSIATHSRDIDKQQKVVEKGMACLPMLLTPVPLIMAALWE